MVYVYKKNQKINKWNERINTKNNNKSTSTVGIWTPKHRDCHE